MHRYRIFLVHLIHLLNYGNLYINYYICCMKDDKLVPVTPKLHLEMKVYCAQNGLQMKYFVEDLIKDKLEQLKKGAETPLDK